MSQHHFSSTLSSGVSVSVLAGWDRPLQRFFLVIEADTIDCQEADGDGIVYSNIYDVEAPSLDWSYFVGVMSEKGVSAPDGLAEALQDDRGRDAGNEVKGWDEPP